MDGRTPWEQAAAAEGTTDSERALTRLAKKAFLSLWSYPNVFTDEGRSNGKGDGKELCDLLVVFGNDVLLFSDKNCEYHSGTDVKVAWPRWYKRAIEKSAKQLAGAEKFAREFPGRIFLDKQCQTPLPIPLPDASVARYFLIAVTRGAHQAARQFFGGGSSGSVMLRSDIRGRKHYEVPFHVGFPLESGRFVHVLDEMTVDLLLEELDTIPDLVGYLACKESFISKPGVFVSIAGEEELVARYMATLKDGRHALPVIPDDVDYVALQEGDWEYYARSPQRGEFSLEVVNRFSLAAASLDLGFDELDLEPALLALRLEFRQRGIVEWIAVIRVGQEWFSKGDMHWGLPASSVRNAHRIDADVLRIPMGWGNRVQRRNCRRQHRKHVRSHHHGVGSLCLGADDPGNRLEIRREHGEVPVRSRWLIKGRERIHQGWSPAAWAPRVADTRLL